MGFGASQQIRPHSTRHHIRRTATTDKKSLESRGVAKLARIEKLKDAPQFTNVIFHRRARHGQSMTSAQQAAGLGRLTAGILDRLCFVQNNVIKLNFTMPYDVATQRSIRCENKIPISQGL